MSSGKCKSKPQRDSTSHPLVWLESKHQIITSIGKVVKQSKFSYITVKSKKGGETLEAVWKLLRVNTWPGNLTPRCISKRKANICPSENSYTNVYSSVIKSSKKWKQLKCPSADEWINHVLYSYDGILLIHKKKNESTNEFWKQYATWKRTVTKDYCFCFF